ncbi:phage tail tape measure protein [Chitinibacter sp. S2-10]|uniref:phage tail tape measure protein n=1 Tax=Chitinibacter sp. S2-10 TaxID=3373597 RepID=UPI003977C136
MSNLETALTLRYRDQASSGLNRMKQDVVRTAEQAARASTDGQRKVQSAYRETSQVFNRSVSEQSRVAQRAADAREQLGIRSENAIQREIAQTEAAYQRLARQGVASATEQQRAYTVMTSKVKALRAEMQGVAQQQEKIVNRTRSGSGGNVVSAGMGLYAAGSMLQRPMMDESAYDLALSYAANTAFADRNTKAGRQAGKAELDLLIRKSTQEGGTRDGALGALDMLMGSGALGDNSAVAMKSAHQMLPTIMKYSNAANADPNELAGIVIKAKQQYGMSDKELPRILDMAMMGGKLGGFELKDMAKWLPQQMAAAKLSGLSGTSGLSKLIALNQKAVISAGNKDEAGNNVVNFLAKLNAEETAKDMKKIGVKDWRGLLIKGRENGKDSVEVFGDVISALMKNNNSYQELKKKAEQAKSGSKEQQEMIGQMSDIVLGQVLGKIQTDRQELMGAIGYVTDRKGTAEIEKKVSGVQAGDVVNLDNAVIRDTAAWKMQQGSNAINEGSNSFFAPINKAFGDLSLRFAQWAKTNPDSAKNVVGGGTLTGALGAGFGVDALARRMMGGSGSSMWSKLWSSGSASALPLALSSAATFSTRDEDDEVLHGDARWKKLRAQYSPQIINAARQQYQPWYQMGDGYAKENEQWIKQYLAELQKQNAAQSKSLEAVMQKPIPVEVTVKVENGNLVASVNKANQTAAGRH